MGAQSVSPKRVRRAVWGRLTVALIPAIEGLERAARGDSFRNDAERDASNALVRLAIAMLRTKPRKSAQQSSFDPDNPYGDDPERYITPEEAFAYRRSVWDRIQLNPDPPEPARRATLGGLLLTILQPDQTPEDAMSDPLNGENVMSENVRFRPTISTRRGPVSMRSRRRPSSSLP